VKTAQVKGRIEIVADSAALYKSAAAEFVSAAKNAVRARGVFTLALAGGSTPRSFYSLLATDPDLRAQVPWGKILFFFGDERHVPPEHPDSNYRMASDAMLSKVPVNPTQVFRIRAEYKEARKAAAEYEQVLRKTLRLQGRVPCIDLVMLGMGAEGHTASLFPGTKALHERRRLVVANWVGKLYTDRITMTPPVLNNAQVMFMVQGADKALALKGVLEGPYEPEQLPAQMIRPRSGKLLWLVDQQAGSLLAGKSAEAKANAAQH
jgi:6-phosphogluconolactonase